MSQLQSPRLSNLERGINRQPRRETVLALVAAFGMDGEARRRFLEVALCRPAGTSGADSPSLPTNPAELQRSKRDMLPPSSLPTGTVTFLFTDVEGSTRLLQQLGETYASVLGR